MNKSALVASQLWKNSFMVQTSKVRIHLQVQLWITSHLLKGAAPSGQVLTTPPMQTLTSALASKHVQHLSASRQIILRIERFLLRKMRIRGTMLLWTNLIRGKCNPTRTFAILRIYMAFHLSSQTPLWITARASFRTERTSCRGDPTSTR